MKRKPYLTSLFHKDKNIFTSVGSLSYEALDSGLSVNLTASLGQIPVGYAHRPDLIAHVFYNSSENWWTFMEANGIKDPFEELNINDIVGFSN